MKTETAGRGSGGMAALLTASLVWAFSFGLIKHKLVATGLDPFFVAFVRLALSFAIFVPFLRLKGIGAGPAVKLVLIGAIQYGLMYATYLSAYRFLAAYEVALFTVFTPLYVTLVNDFSARHFDRRAFLASLLAVAGAAFVVWTGEDRHGTLAGFALMQVSNLCFAAGQVWYGRMERRSGDTRIFALLYLGAVVTAAIPAFFSGAGHAAALTTEQVVTLLYLGIIPSGICFFLWNAGARRARPGRLAVMNNAKIPLAVLCSLLVFGEPADLRRLILGGSAILAAAALCAPRLLVPTARS